MDLTDFFTHSLIAKKVKLPGKIVIHRTSYNPAEIAVMNKTARYGPISPEEEVCELEVNGEVIATGKIIKKAGEFYFKVKELNKEVTG